MLMTLGLLLWVKLRLVSDFPRTAFAEDDQHQVDEPQVRASPEDELQSDVQ